MTPVHKTIVAAGLILIALAAGARAGDEGLVSTMSLVAAVPEIDGISIVPATDAPVKVYTEDYGPSQVLEIIRPNQAPVSIGRLNSSCTCVQASLPKKDYAQGERVLIEVRNVKSTPPDGAKYAVFVQLTQPVKQVLQYDIFVKSTKKPEKKAIQGTMSPPLDEHGRPTATTVLKGADERGILTFTAPPQPTRRSGTPPVKYENVVPYRSRSQGQQQNAE